MSRSVSGFGSVNATILSPPASPSLAKVPGSTPATVSTALVGITPCCASVLSDSVFQIPASALNSPEPVFSSYARRFGLGCQGFI